MTGPFPVVAEPREQRLERLRRDVLPVVVWCVLAAVAATMLVDRGRYVQHVGVAQGLETPVSPTVTGRIQALVVSLNDRVTQGQVVALMEDAQVRAMLNTAQAGLRKLRADLMAAGASLAVDSGQVATDLLRLRMDEESRRLDALSLRATFAGDAVEIERLRLEAGRVEALAREGLAPPSDLENARLAHEQLRTRQQKTEATLSETEAGWRAARARREAFERRLPAGSDERLLLAPLREAITVEETRLREIELQRDALVLRSPAAGQVNHVWCGVGQTVRAGDPVLTIAETAVRSIIVYVDETETNQLAPRATVSVATRTPPRAVAESVVVSVGQSVIPLPPRFWRDPRVPTYGRAVVVDPTPTLPLSAGELVDVRLTRR